MVQVSERKVNTNGIELNIAEAGQGPLLLLTHGFPESWYSWRHQFEPLASAGYHVVAPNMRGYGKSDSPVEIPSYNQVNIVADVVGLIPALGYDTAIIIGHDWGAPTAWLSAQMHPEKISAVGALSVPFSPRSESPPLENLKARFKDRFFYQLYFQEPGKAEAELERDIRISLRKFLFMASADAKAGAPMVRPADADLLSDMPDPEVLPGWLTDADLDYYVKEFETSGFRGPLNYYRNHNLTWELTCDVPGKIEQPAMFVAGEKDGVIALAAEALKKMPSLVQDLRVNELIPACGHWTQQEKPEEVTGLILSFLASL